jgi:hypothetical protein
MEKEEQIRVHFKCRALLPEFYIQTSEENMNIVLSQNKVFETNPELNLLINNKRKKQNVKPEKNRLHQETLHHITMTQES